MPDFAVIIPAAGASTRFGGTRSKLLERVGGELVILRSVRAFSERSDCRLIIIPTPPGGGSWPDALAEVRQAFAKLGTRIQLCEGGKDRASSVWNALKRVPDSIDWVAVHDGARPLVSQQVIDHTLAAAIAHGAAVPAMPVSLTIKEAEGPLPTKVIRTVPRQRLWAMQTPQIARRADLLRAFATCQVPLDQVTDDVQLIELSGGEVWLVQGDERNLKITTPIDLTVADMWATQA